MTTIFIKRPHAVRPRVAGKQRVGVRYPSSRFPLRAGCANFFAHSCTVPRDAMADATCPECVRCATRTRDARRFHYTQSTQRRPRLAVFTFVVTGVADIENMYSVLKVSERAQRVRRYTLPSRFNRSDALCLPRVHPPCVVAAVGPPDKVQPWSRFPRSTPQTKHRRCLNASHHMQMHQLNATTTPLQFATPR